MQEIKKFINQALHQEKQKFVYGKTKIPLVVPTYHEEEVCEVLDCLLTTYVTMGRKVKEFEKAFADYIGAKHAIMFNSGSSANLIALSIVTNPWFPDRLHPGDEVIVPAVCWSTTVFPIINCGLIPVFVDVDLDTLNLSVKKIEKALSKKTRAIIPVHLLGNPCDMRKITEIAEDKKLILIEDACEAHGAELEGKKVGSFGLMGTFSFFFSHHISTIEGGMLVTNDDKVAELARVMRAHGWVRDMNNKEAIIKENPDIDPRFLFVNIGYNFRPTELQGAIGIHQIKKLDDFVKIRRENARYWTEELKKYPDFFLVHDETPGTKHTWFAYPVTVAKTAPFSKKELQSFLESRGVETRQIESGNMAEQPVMKLFPHKTAGDLPNARFIMRNSFFWGNHHQIGKIERRMIINYVKEFLSEYT